MMKLLQSSFDHLSYLYSRTILCDIFSQTLLDDQMD